MATTDAQPEKAREFAEQAFRVSDRVEIRDVVLVAAGLLRSDVREGASLNADIERRAFATMAPDTNLLRVRVDFGFIARQTDPPAEKNAVEVRATYDVTYEVPDQSDLTQEHFDAFANVNGVFNAWPYFREFLQSSLGRMSLPPFTLPVLRMGATRRSSVRTSSDS